jgi:exonuclease SbcC
MTGKNLTASATVSVNGKIAATSAETVTKYIQKKLGMDFRSFFTSIFAKQKDLNALSTMIASERRPLILRMLGIDFIDDVIKEIKSDKREKERYVQKLSNDLIDEKGKYRIQNYREEIKNLEKEKKGLDSQNQKLKEKIKNLKKEISELEKKYNKIKKDYEHFREKKEKLTQLKTLFEHKNKFTEEAKILSDKIVNRQKIVKQYKTKLISFKNIDIETRSCEKRLHELDLKIENLIKRIEQKKTLVNRFNIDIKEIVSKIIKIKKIGPDAKCPTCERVLSNQYKELLNKFEQEINHKQKEIAGFKKEIITLNNENKKLSREKEAFLKKRIYFQYQFREKEQIETTIKNILNEIKLEKTEIAQIEQELKNLQKIKFEINEYNIVVKQVDHFYINYQNSLDLRDSKNKDLNNLNIDFERKESDIKLILQKIESLYEKISLLEEYQKKIKDEKKVLSNLETLSDLMSEFRTHLISRIQPTLSAYSSDFFRRLTNGKYTEIELDKNYNLIIYDKGNAFGIERFSGGEEDLANLCLRLAISEVITERAGGIFNFIILDEIFGSQDMYRRQNIMKALNGLSSKFRQIFLITHVNDVKDDMENIIFVTEDNDGISSIKLK